MDWVEGLRSMLEAPSPAVLTTYRRDGTAAPTPVWYRWHEGVFEWIVAVGDVKLEHLARRPECVFTVFETVRPFRGVEVRGTPEIIEIDVTPVRREIAGRYLGAQDGERYAAQRPAGVLLRLPAAGARVWDLAWMLP